MPPSPDSPNVVLFAAALMDAGAAIIHFACIPWGARGYRTLGAGKVVVRMAEAGHWYPPFIASAIGSLLLVWAAYVLSAGGYLPAFPLVGIVVPAITAVFLLRAVAFPLLKPAFPGNSTRFWWISSAICLIIGLTHLLGLLFGGAS